MRAEVVGSSQQLRDHIWSSRYYTPTPAGGVEEPLFSLPGRSALELQGFAVDAPGASASPQQLQEVRVYGRGGDTRLLLARAQFTTKTQGRLLLVRDVIAPHLDVTIKSLDAGPVDPPAPWRFVCSAWGAEPSHDLPDTYGRTAGLSEIGDPPAQLTDQAWVLPIAGELSWFQCWKEYGSGKAWLHLYDTPQASPVFDPSTLRMSWPIMGAEGQPQNGVVELRPRRPVQLHRGGVLIVSNSPTDPAFSGEKIWAHWATRPFVNVEPWRQPLALP